MTRTPDCWFSQSTSAGAAHSDDRDAHVFAFALTVGEPVHHEPDEHRADDDAEDDRPERASIA
jgi:hypothetical protein